MTNACLPDFRIFFFLVTGITTQPEAGAFKGGATSCQGQIDSETTI